MNLEGAGEETRKLREQIMECTARSAEQGQCRPLGGTPCYQQRASFYGPRSRDLIRTGLPRKAPASNTATLGTRAPTYGWGRWTVHRSQCKKFHLRERLT